MLLYLIVLHIIPVCRYGNIIAHVPQAKSKDVASGLSDDVHPIHCCSILPQVGHPHPFVRITRSELFEFYKIGYNSWLSAPLINLFLYTVQDAGQVEVE